MSVQIPHSVILLMGPTGAGKTDVAIQLAERWPIEIISVDSALVYRGMDIGTGKPTADVLARYPHHLVDILDPSQSYSAGQFVRDARRAMDEIRARGRIPLLVGGTMLYFRALRFGLAELPEADPTVRAAIDQQGAERGWPALHTELAQIDPEAAARIQPNDAQRIQRALEVFRLTGRPLSEIQKATQAPADLVFDAIAWGPSDRERLYAGIEARFHRMLEQGLLDEVRRLYERSDLHDRLPAIRSVGYRQLWEHLRGTEPLTSAVQKAIAATRQLARRQLIWLRGDTGVDWIDSLETRAVAHIERRLETLCRRQSPY